jgi:hypothetical protein
MEKEVFMHDEVTTQPNGVQIDSQLECQRLRDTVARLEAERDEYKAALYRVLHAQVKMEDIVLPDEGDCQTFDRFLPELEELAGLKQ